MKPRADGGPPPSKARGGDDHGQQPRVFAGGSGGICDHRARLIHLGAMRCSKRISRL
jgi:hypothetical protein